MDDTARRWARALFLWLNTSRIWLELKAVLSALVIIALAETMR